MLACTSSCAMVGLEGFIIRVEVDLSPGVPRFNMVGLPDTAVQEAKERVRAALRNSGCDFPMRRITVNLAPADLKKEGPAYDLPIAIAILLSSGQLESAPADAVFLGELSLDGSLRHTNGILTMVSVARNRGFESVFVPAVDAEEASLVEDITVYPADTLDSVLRPPPGRGASDTDERRRVGSMLRPALRPGPDGSRTHQGSGTRQKGAGGGRSGFSQPVVQRASRQRKDPVGPLPAIHPPSHGAPGSAGSNQDIQRQWFPAERKPLDVAAALPVAPLHHLQRGSGRRRAHPASRRNHPQPPGRAVPGRTSGIQPLGARVLAPASRG